MIPGNHHRFAVEFFNEEWTSLGRQRLSIDLEPARECAQLELWRGDDAGCGAAAGPGRVVPLWSASLGVPFVEGFRYEWDRRDGGAVGVDFTNTYFRDAAVSAAACYVRDGSLRKRETFRYLVLAFPAQPEAPTVTGPARASEPAGGLRLTARRESVPPVVTEASLSRMRSASRTSDVDESDLPVFVPDSLLREVARLSRAAGASETGGGGVGRRHRDRELSALFVEVTDQLPALHAPATTDRLNFTPETWRAWEIALAQRASGEIRLGWWHSHPAGAWAARDRAEGTASPVRTDGFLSQHDRALHRAVFAAAYCVALVVTDPGEGEPEITLFGWRKGALIRRGFGRLPVRGDPESSGARIQPDPRNPHPPSEGGTP